MKPLIIFPDPILREISQPIERVDIDIISLVDDMLDVMYYNNGVGLAAVQIGFLYRLVVIDVSRDYKNNNHMVFINPVILSSSKDCSVCVEGCLSIPDYRYEVKRPSYITVKYLNCDLQPNIIYADGLLSTCLQHEIDHLNGILFIDHISLLKRNMVKNKFAKLAKLQK
ncbi:N-formylmethionyl-tRNA deformylase [Candidatus Liberibacter americanus str. Sao Paulo]|uniref:Peptide deformylase n=2 Tax=Candidatus Liberibacter americanus TaxID=309868 RepID=U6B928_9HYPH|nr:N-formylmethionyl-tRNA deformylase [Candidatus Liberibacter americanus str. Sao Paulo]EMS36264.1 peptide deformylase [Candidatus Liberibacter americanus PW_SP]